MKIIIANPIGFCAGVKRAINIVNYVLRIYKAPIYVKHEIVHNTYIINNFRKQGVKFIENISQVPDGAILIFSAHGVSKKIKHEAYSRNFLAIYDATCPLVTKVHMDVQRASRYGKEIILIGHRGHPEIEGTIGQYENKNGGVYLIESENDLKNLKIKNENNLCYMSQTTLSIYDTKNIINALHTRFPKITGPHKNHICYATTNRQQAVNELINKVDIILIIGSKTSSNSNRLLELGKIKGKPSFLIDSPNDIKKIYFKKNTNIGLTAGASTPNFIINKIIDQLKIIGVNKIIKLSGIKENIVFKIPKTLRLKINNL